MEKQKKDKVRKSLKNIFESIIKENIIKENTLKEDTKKENTLKENTLKENTKKENTKKENTLKDKNKLEEEFYNRNTDYKKFSDFLNTAYTSLFGFGNTEELLWGKLEDTVYIQIKEDIASLWNDYSYSKCVIWIGKLKDQFRLYYIDEENKDDKIKQVHFYKRTCDILYRIYQELHVDEENVLARAKEVYDNSYKIFSLLAESIKLSCNQNISDESDEYSSYTNDKLIEKFKKLEKTSAKKRDNLEYLEELNKKIDLLQEIIDRSGIENKGEYFEKLKKLQKERAKKKGKCCNKKIEPESIKLSKINNDIELVVKGNKELDVMEYGSDYIDLIERVCREKKNHADKDILEIIKEQQEQIKKENSEAMF